MSKPSELVWFLDEHRVAGVGLADAVRDCPVALLLRASIGLAAAKIRQLSAGREDPGVLDRRQSRRGSGPSCLARLAGRAFCVLLWGPRAHTLPGVDPLMSASRHPKLDNPGSAGDDDEQDPQYCGEKERHTQWQVTVSAEEADVHLLAVFQDEDQEQDEHDGERHRGEPHPAHARALHPVLWRQLLWLGGVRGHNITAFQDPTGITCYM